MALHKHMAKHMDTPNVIATPGTHQQGLAGTTPAPAAPPLPAPPAKRSKDKRVRPKKKKIQTPVSNTSGLAIIVVPMYPCSVQFVKQCFSKVGHWVSLVWLTGYKDSGFHNLRSNVGTGSWIVFLR